MHRLPAISHASSDQYSSEKYVTLVKLEEELREIQEKEKKTTADKREMKRLEKEIAPLKSFVEDAASHRKAIKSEIGIPIFVFPANFLDTLKDDETKCIIVVDFTKFTIVTDGSVSCFVVAVVSHDSDMDVDGNFRGILP